MCFFDVFRSLFGCLLRVSWGLIGLGRLGGLSAVPEASWSVLGALVEPLGASDLLGPLGASWAPLGAIVGPFLAHPWEPWGPSWGHLGGDRSKKEG
eukprot:5312383-Pyramimonas_sp.AAC.1